MSGKTKARKPYPDVRPGFVALGLLAEGPAHGYELFRRFRASLDGLWHISESQFYATLKRLELQDLISASAPEKGDGATKRHLTLNPEGRLLLLDWIAEPTIANPRLLHLEFLTRLFFARRIEPRKLERIVADQAACLRSDIERIGKLRDAGRARDDIDSLSIEFRTSQLRAVLDWLEGSVCPTVGRRAQPRTGASDGP